MSLENVLDTLPKLTPEELSEVRQRIMALTSVDAVPDEDDWLLKGIIVVLSDRGLAETVPYRFRITNGRQFHGYKAKAEKVRNTVLSAITRPSKLDKIALGRLLARCLAEEVERFRPVTLNAMLQHVELSLPALDRCFPGYLKSGRLDVLTRGIKSRAAD